MTLRVSLEICIGVEIGYKITCYKNKITNQYVRNTWNEWKPIVSNKANTRLRYTQVDRLEISHVQRL